MPEEQEEQELEEAAANAEAEEAAFLEGHEEASADETRPTILIEESGQEEELDELDKVFAEDGEAAAGEADDKSDEPQAVDQSGQRIRTLEGQYGDINGKLNQLIKKLDSSPKAESGQPSSAQVMEAATGGEKFDEFKEEFPEWADVLQEQLGMQGNAILAKIPNVDKLQQQVAGLKGEMADLTEQGRQMAVLDLKHDGWEDTVKTPAFRKWSAIQSPDMQALADSPKARDAVTMLDKFEADRTAAQEKAEKRKERSRLAKERLEGSVVPITSGGGNDRRPATKSEEDAFEQGYKEG